MNKLLYIIVLLVGVSSLAQQVPGKEENIPFLITFGQQAKTNYGDDDFKQCIYFAVPSSHKSLFYIRIFDPGVGGKHDEKINEFDSETKFTVFGGKGVYSNVLGKNASYLSELPTGDALYEETFDDDEDYDDVWIKTGPFNPAEGEYVKSMDAYVFKMLVEGKSGNDGNVYKLFLSSKPNMNVELAGANAFTFEYTVRLHDTNTEVSHLYPFIDKKVIRIRQQNFDLDASCVMTIQSVAKPGERTEASGDNRWSQSEHVIVDKERESCMDFRLVNNRTPQQANNNNVVLSITNQYGESLPFMAVPLGEYKYSGQPVFSALED